MKNKICLLTLSFFLTATSNKSFAQNYSSLFADTSTTWNIILHGYCDAICSSTIIVTGDTIIGANTYQIISGLPGFVREDTVQGKAWFYDTYNSNEYLVMDLGLNLGDTFNIYNYSNTAFPFLVDSVYYVSSKKYVQLTAWTMMCGFYQKVTFIESSGTTASFGYQRDLNGSYLSSYMLCQHKNGVKVLGNSLFMDTCYVCSVGIPEYNSDADVVKLFPNPTNDVLSIETRNIPSNNSYLSIFNVLEERIVYQKLIGRLTTLDISNLHNGVYVVMVGNQHHRMIKQ